MPRRRRIRSRYADPAWQPAAPGGRVPDGYVVDRDFSSIEELIAAASDGPPKHGGDASRKVGADGRFNDFPSFEAAVEAGRFGWPEGAARIERASHSLAAGVMRTHRASRLAQTVSGGAVCIPEYLAGVPTCMRRREVFHRPARVIRIVAHLGGICTVTADEKFRRGALIVSAIDALESSGVRVELIGVNDHTSGAHGTVAFRVVLKRAQDALDIDRLAFALCSADYHRRLVFGVAERCPYPFAGCGGYGTSTNAPRSREACDLYLPVVEPGDISGTEQALAALVEASTH